MIEEGLELKEACLEHCSHLLADQLATLSSSLESIRGSRSSETKSSAGDKFETGRAMLQLEENNLKQQLAAALETRRLLDQAHRSTTGDRIAHGNLVATNRGIYLLAAGFGKIKVKTRDVFCISPGSPIGRRLLGKIAGEAFLFNEVRFQVLGFV
ncbi:hypothetical protein [Lewinella sp. 4G2]|uniref:hypothetical protein n=1 Tax=Lewinella sp. 4G2 TaxID=1803372 RepID=UPI0007B4C449|nr:hypothetical protein [Lewinella sp. 4G2]OAV45014.1 hypothetical protein A3850_011175 [Lewinella sp. 4G2]